MRISPVFRNRYLSVNGLAGHRNLHGLFSPQLQEVLVRDPCLRHVFLQVLPDRQLGRLQTVETKIPAPVDADFLAEHSAFLASNDPEIVSHLVKQGREIIVGVVDREGPPMEIKFKPNAKQTAHYYVANARTAFCPLADGSWLGLKGSGFFDNEAETAPTHTAGKRNGKHWGIVAKSELEWIYGYSQIFCDQAAVHPTWFSQLLGHRRLYALPDGRGRLLPARQLKYLGEPALPHLVFYRTIHPHRINKLPQLLETDPSLSYLCHQVSQGLSAMSPRQTLFSSSEMMLLIAGTIGEAEGYKAAAGLYRTSTHAQDFNFGGQQAIDSFADGAEEPKDWAGFQDLNMYQAFQTICALFKQILTYDFQHQTDWTSSHFPNKPRFLRVFFESFFSNLDAPRLARWADQPNIEKLARGVKAEIRRLKQQPLLKILDTESIEIFHPHYHPSQTEKTRVRQVTSVALWLIGLAEKELKRRTEFLAK